METDKTPALPFSTEAAQISARLLVFEQLLALAPSAKHVEQLAADWGVAIPPARRP